MTNLMQQPKYTWHTHTTFNSIKINNKIEHNLTPPQSVLFVIIFIFTEIYLLFESANIWEKSEPEFGHPLLAFEIFFKIIKANKHLWYPLFKFSYS